MKAEAAEATKTATQYIICWVLRPRINILLGYDQNKSFFDDLGGVVEEAPRQIAR